MTYEIIAVEAGTVTTPAVTGGNSLSDATKAWQNGVHKNRTVRILNGQGAGQVAFVQDNSRDSLIIRGGWLKPLAVGDTYAIISADFMQDLRDVFGGGVNIGIANPLPVTDSALDVAFSTRASEATLVKLIPITKAALFNQALPAAEASWLGVNITPTNSPSYLRLYVSVAAGGVLRIARTVGGVTVVEDLNHGVPLLANSAYLFTGIEWRAGDSLNIRYSATGANILSFRADEIGGAD